MPVKILSAAAAHENGRKPVAKWPLTPEAQAERLMPLAKPQFTAHFNIHKEDLVFTVGSCFARNIEKQLAAEGFDYASKDFDIPEDERDFPAAISDILNKYVCFSVLNELKWALVPGESFPEDGYVEVRNGKVADSHLHQVIVPSSLERARKRRQYVTDYMKLAAKSKVFIMTLGLGEAWYDTKTGLYLNAMPHRSSRDREPERFEFHVLDYNQILQCLEDIHALLTEYGDPDLKFLFTVSPVALGTSFSGNDALIANTYSKSVQRAAVAAFVENHDNVDYFPSYESVVLSERSRAWRDDQAHASEEIIRYNVLKMMGAYMPEGHAGSADALDQADRMAEAFDLMKQAKKLTDAGATQDAMAAFRKACDIAPTEGLILLEFSRFLAKYNQWPEAIRYAKESTLYNSGPWSGWFHLTQCYRAIGDWDNAYEAITQAQVYEPLRPGVMHMTGLVCNQLMRYGEAIEILEKLLKLNPDFEMAKRDYMTAITETGQEIRGEAFLESLKAAAE